jgi:hypothetical protein
MHAQPLRQLLCPARASRAASPVQQGYHRLSACAVSTQQPTSLPPLPLQWSQGQHSPLQQRQQQLHARASPLLWQLGPVPGSPEDHDHPPTHVRLQQQTQIAGIYASGASGRGTGWRAPTPCEPSARDQVLLADHLVVACPPCGAPTQGDKLHATRAGRACTRRLQPDDHFAQFTCRALRAHGFLPF